MNRALFVFWCVLLVTSVVAGGGWRNRNYNDDGDEDEDICSRLKNERQDEDEREGRTWPRRGGEEGGEDGGDDDEGEGNDRRQNGGNRDRDGEMPERDINEDLLDLLTEDEPARCGSGRSCIKGMSDCSDNGQCTCKDRYAWGNPNFACYKNNEMGAEVKNDPLLVTFGQESIRFPYPCRYMITHVKQKLKDKNGNRVGSCEFEVYGYNSRKDGKFFVLGFDVAAKLKYNTGEVVKLSSRNYGLVKNKKPTLFNSGTLDDYSPNGPWQRKKIEYKDARNGIFVNLKGRPNNKQIEYEVESCGFRITFVPYDIIKKRRQANVPGISVTVKRGYNLEWFGETKAMNLVPAWGDSGSLEGQRLQGLDEQKSMLVRAFTTDVVQNQPGGASEQCEAVGTAIGECTWQQRAAAINSCFWILDQPRFMRCYDRSHNSKRLLKLFKKCVNIFCNGGSCQDVQDKITQRGCHDVPEIRPLRQFMRGDMCPE